MALQEPLMKKSSFAEIFIPPLGNSLFCYHRLECIRIWIEESKEIVQKETLHGFRLLLSIERSSRYICTNDRNSQWIANMWNDYWQGENLHGRTVSFKWTNITSQNDATVLRYTFRYKRAIRPGTNATANLYELERASRPRTTSCLGVKGVINNKPGEIFLFSSSSLHPARNLTDKEVTLKMK